jgi:hypothetical protein
MLSLIIPVPAQSSSSKPRLRNAINKEVFLPDWQHDEGGNYGEPDSNPFAMGQSSWDRDHDAYPQKVGGYDAPLAVCSCPQARYAGQ